MNMESLTNEISEINDKLHLVPGHCDPTCNLHDWYVCVRDGIVVDLWPVSARGKRGDRYFSLVYNDGF